MSAVGYRTDVRRLTALVTRLRGARPATTIRAAAPAPAAPRTAAGDVQVSRHIYMSDQPEPGQETTALGRFMADQTILVPAERPDPSLAANTQIINRHGIEQALTRRAEQQTSLADPVLFNALVDELGGYPSYDSPTGPHEAAVRDDSGDLARLPVVRPDHLGQA